ncbi:trypsin-like serine protease [Bdellovibrio sp. 22V]|uniref:S1 family peptidase n=1 Tax=Bdellovibrio TaxID=958 RepID=UPI002542C923|nr:trypsin-like serine protease [Bdellovibrio sp. 22V]WII70621.1 trypsin-like serine protease [Bdellovibrio sp. 22V]
MSVRMSLLLASLIALSACSEKTSESLTLGGADTSIIGGEAAKATDTVTSSTVSLIYNLEASPYLFCTGTVISKNLILTATHCLEQLDPENDKENVSIYLGETLPTSFEKNAGFEVESWKVHPEYKMVLDSNGFPRTGVNDVALIKLKKDLPGTAQIIPILEENIALANGQSLLLAGYGLTNEINQPVRAKGLNYVRVPLAKTFDNILVTDQTRAKGACSGDSGGPAYLETSRGLIVVGITRGPHELAPDCRHYGEYTFASRFKKFILETAAELGADAPHFVDLPQ